jgi:hypothetical protein
LPVGVDCISAVYAGSGCADALTDGLRLICYLFGLRGNAFTAKALDCAHQRTRHPRRAITRKGRRRHAIE